MDTEESRSLLALERAEEARQPLLFSLPECEEAQRVKQFTGEGLMQSRPLVYKLVVAAIGAGVSDVQIAKSLGVSPNTVAAIRRSEHAEVADLKQQTAREFRRAAAGAIEVFTEGLAKVDPSDPQALKALAIAAGVFTDKAQLLEGEPTLRVEEVKRVDPEQFNRLIRSLPAGTGFGVELGLQSGAAIEVDGEVIGEAEDESSPGRN